jgi:hypothetical protein
MMGDEQGPRKGPWVAVMEEEEAKLSSGVQLLKR